MAAGAGETTGRGTRGSAPETRHGRTPPRLLRAGACPPQAPPPSGLRSGCKLVAPTKDHLARAQTQTEAGLEGLRHYRASRTPPLAAAPSSAERPVRVVGVCPAPKRDSQAACQEGLD